MAEPTEPTAPTDPVKPPKPPKIVRPDLDGLEPIKRLTRDLRTAAATLTATEARYLVDAYYQMQRDRIRAGHQARTLTEAGEPSDVIGWLQSNTEILERNIKSALGAYSQSQVVGRWAECAPPGSQVMVEGTGRWGAPRSVPIETLVTDMSVVSFNRHKRALTTPRPIQVAARPFAGLLTVIQTDVAATKTTGNHKWLVRLNAAQDVCVVYLMRRGHRFRVGWCRAMSRPADRTNGRFHLRARCRQEKADQAWVLKFLPTPQAASLYESWVAAKYGLTQMPFQPLRHSTLYDQRGVDAFYAMLDQVPMFQRAVDCLSDHGLDLETPLLFGVGDGSKESVNSLLMYAANLAPDVMQIPVPCKVGFEWRTITAITQESYAGPVYSLNVAEHHKYVQDGLITCNSIVGIGPVISAGLLAHITLEPWRCANPKRARAVVCKPGEPCTPICGIRPTETVGKIWRFAGLDPTVTWKEGEKRPWNGALKRLCWIIGESFVKVQAHQDDVYGKLYAQRKLIEEAKNEAGDFKAQADISLATKRWQRETSTRTAYEAGHLPQARIHLRAERWAVKLFLAHWFTVAYYHRWQKMPPLPYVQQHLGHTDMIPVPNWPFDGPHPAGAPPKTPKDR